MYLAIGGNGYGRCDVRMNARGEIYILEINPNGGILYTPEEYGPADYMILYDKDGYDGFFDRIFRAALVQQKMRKAKRIK
jgi:D-alanine-D-alanine ligase